MVISPTVGWSLLGLGVASFALFFYIFIFIFISGSSNTGQAYDKFIMTICSPKGDGEFFKTVLTWGYFKRSFKRFYQHYRLVLFPQPRAELGKPCPDATVITLENQGVRSLLRDYIDNAGDMPVILNMGSYT